MSTDPANPAARAADDLPGNDGPAEPDGFVSLDDVAEGRDPAAFGQAETDTEDVEEGTQASDRYPDHEGTGGVTASDTAL